MSDSDIPKLIKKVQEEIEYHKKCEPLKIDNLVDRLNNFIDIIKNQRKEIFDLKRVCNSRLATLRVLDEQKEKIMKVILSEWGEIKHED